ncbi:unnamed protein product [Closterium sp. Yama58-4]|nr:unnamed protein product [Closterium sp. Yama58-4]
MAGKRITLRVRSRDGLERVQLDESEATVSGLRAQISQQLAIPLADLILSTDQSLLLSADPEKFKDLADPSVSLESLGIGHGSIVFAKYSASRTVAGPPVPVVPAGSFGRHMTVSDMVARQMRIERQETSHCQQVSFDRDAANVFQHYVHDSLAFSIKRGGFLFGEVREDGHVLVDFIYEPPQHGTEHTLQIFPNEEDQQAQEHSLTLSASDLLLSARLHCATARESSGEKAAGEGEESAGGTGNAGAQAGGRGNGDGAAGGEGEKKGGEEVGEPFKYFAVVLVKLLVDEEGDGGGDVHFEAFQLSDQCLKLYREGWDTYEVDNDFFLMPIKIVDHQGPLTTSFPVENRVILPTQDDLKQHLDRTRSKPWADRLADFHLLLYLSNFLDASTDMPMLAQAVRTKEPISEGHQLIIEHLA